MTIYRIRNLNKSDFSKQKLCFPLLSFILIDILIFLIHYFYIKQLAKRIG